MRHVIRKICYAYTLLLILLAAMAGQKVHIYTENPLHFAAFAGDRMPDNGADCGMVEKCVVDDYFFFPCVCVERPLFQVCFSFVGRPADLPVRARQAGDMQRYALRAPPVGA